MTGTVVKVLPAMPTEHQVPGPVPISAHQRHAEGRGVCSSTQRRAPGGGHGVSSVWNRDLPPSDPSPLCGTPDSTKQASAETLPHPNALLF